RVRVTAVVHDARQQLVQGPGVAELVLRNRAHRDVLLEDRRDAGPFGVGEARHELVVGHRQQELSQRGAGGRRQRCEGAHWPFIFPIGSSIVARTVPSPLRATSRVIGRSPGHQASQWRWPTEAVTTRPSGRSTSTAATPSMIRPPARDAVPAPTPPFESSSRARGPANGPRGWFDPPPPAF